MEKKHNTINYLFVLILITQFLIGYMIYQNSSNVSSYIQAVGVNDRYEFLEQKALMLDKKTGIITYMETENFTEIDYENHTIEEFELIKKENW